MRLPTFAFSFFFFYFFCFLLFFPFSLPLSLSLPPSLSVRLKKSETVSYMPISTVPLCRHVFPTYSLNGRKRKGTKTNLIVRKASQRLSYVCVVCTRVITRLSEVRGLALATLQPSSLPWSREAET